MSLPDVICRERVIPVARGLDATSAPRMVDALLAGGINTIEITVEAPGGMDAIASVASRLAVGAGTVVSVGQALSAVAAGATFLVCPHVDEELLAWASASAVPLIPGAFTPTEIATAHRHRPPAIKVFPASIGGPGYVRSLLGPYPDLELIPTGGVDADNIAGYLAAGAVAAGVGGWLTGLEDHAEVTRRAARLVDAVARSA
jgi:2-dehydro-3-deoxyphosphogluconate aldolase / (4S)-4-hydroxy-2-oxoglutarate aldolase